MLNKKHENIAYNIIDVAKPSVHPELKTKLEAIKGVFMVRIIQS
jgi:D-3-phosphoglycerate dehydrogenase